MDDSKIPYVFYPIPPELMTDEFIEDILMMKMIREIFKRVRKHSHIEPYYNNKRLEHVQLQKDQFIYGRKKWAEKFNTSEQKIRTRLDRLVELKYIERLENNEILKTSSSTSSPCQVSTSSSTSSYSILRLCTETFYAINNFQNNQQFNQQFNQQSLANDNHKARIQEKLDIQENNSSCKITPIYEGWKFQDGNQQKSKEKTLPNNNVHYQTFDIEKMICDLRTFGFSDEDIHNLKEQQVPVERILLALDFARKSKIKKTEKHTIFWHVKQTTPPDPPELKLEPKEHVKLHFINGEQYNDAYCFIDEKCITFQRGMTSQSLKFSEQGFEDQFQNLLRKFNIPIPTNEKIG